MIKEISTKQLLSVFTDIKNSSSESKICFIIGAGASRQSGIRTGAELSKIWFDEIQNIFEKEDRRLVNC